MGKVRFFCDCGKEIWKGMGEDEKRYITIKYAEDMCICSDCVLKKIRERED